MKKFLSLVLALVMTMSLVTVSAGAKDFTDSDKIQYTEAVDVMSAVKVIDGFTDGSFNPSAPLNRGQAAKIICNLILGPTTAAALSADTAPFKDVPVDHHFAGYIAYCSQQGIISGYADGAFRPTAPLTSYAFMKMLLGALGYDSNIEGYVGPNWSIQVAKRALNLGLDDGLVDEFNGTDAVTREEACLFALNTMTSDMVDYDNRTTVSVGGAEVVIAGSKAEPVKNDAKKETIFEDDVLQFAEKYFTNLKLDANATDDFARPANEWKVKAETVGVYTHTADATYSKGVKVEEIYKDLGLGSKIAKDDVQVYLNGVEASPAAYTISKGDETKIAGSDNGVLTEVFYDSKADTAVITMIDTYVGTINKTVPAKGNKDAYIEIAVETEKPANVSGVLKFETAVEFEDDTYVLYTYSESAEEVISVAEAELVSGTVTKAENSNTNTADKKALTIDGTRYTASKKISGMPVGDITVKEDYDVYLDAYGYMIYVVEQENTNYALVLSVASKSDYVGKKAELLFADGTTKVVNTDKYYDTFGDNGAYDPLTTGNGKVANQIVSYRVDDDNVYTLKAVNTTVVKASEVLDLKSDRAAISVGTPVTTVTANSATTFVIGEAGQTNTTAIDEFYAYTGIKNAPSVNAPNTTTDNGADVYYYCKNSGRMVTIMFVLPEKDATVEDDANKSVFLAKASVGNLIHDTDGDYFEYKAVINGETVTAKVADNVTVDKLPVPAWTDANGVVHAAGSSAAVKGTLNGLYKSYSVNKKGIITNLNTYAGDLFDGNLKGYLGNIVGIDRTSKDYTILMGKSGATYTYVLSIDEKAPIYYVDKDGVISESSYKALAQDDNDIVYAYVKDGMIQTLFVQEVKPLAVTYGVQFAPATGDAYADFKINGNVVTNTTLYDCDKNDDVDFYVEAVSGREIVSVTATGGTLLGPDANGNYRVQKVKGLVTVTVDTQPIAAPTTEQVFNVTFKYPDNSTKLAVVSASFAGGVWTLNTTDDVLVDALNDATYVISVLDVTTGFIGAPVAVEATLADADGYAHAYNSATLQAALGDPTVDTIFLSDGTFAANCDVNHSVTIIGNGDSSVITPSAVPVNTDKQNGLYIDKANVNVTVENVKFQCVSSTRAFLATGSANGDVVLKNCTVEGGDVWLNSAVTATIENCTFNNVGNAIHVETGATAPVAVTNCTFETVTGSRCVYDVTGTDVTFAGNTNNSGKPLNTAEWTEANP